VDWQGFLAGYGVAVDWPSCSFYEVLMEAFPQAPVILTVRDPAPWYESTRSTIHELRGVTTGPLPVRAAFALARLFVPGVTGTVRLADRLVWEGTFDSRFEDRAYAMEGFERHNEAVRRRVPPERMLVFDMREGWAPLCDFLGVEVPEEPFPRLNEAREMRRRLLGLFALSAAAPALAVLTGVAGTVFLVRRVARSRYR
jgi:Sulfotransferase domain